MKRFLLPLCAVLAGASISARAMADDPPDAGKIWASCTEHLPKGAVRPEMTEVFPAQGLSGYAAELQISVVHGKGETVLPDGLRIQKQSDAAKALEEAHFVIPEPDGGAGFSISTEGTETQSTTKVRIPFVPLPPDPGRNYMVLPPIPIAIARASGEYITICSDPHPIVIEDPIANEADPKVKPNPPPRPQREEWVAAKYAAFGLALVTVTALITALIVKRYKARPKTIVLPPPKLPWDAALEELEAIRSSTLLEEKRSAEYFDRVSDCVRKYLGARYGFDGLESTSDEIRIVLKRVYPPVPVLKDIDQFLSDCDLVKFARVVPMENECLEALTRGETIVKTTIPPPSVLTERKPKAGGAA